MALTKECKQEMEHLLTLVERQKQYRTGVVFPSRMNNYFYDAGTGKILRLQDEEYRLLKAIFSPQATVKTVMQAFSEEAPNKVEAFLRNTAQMEDCLFASELEPLPPLARLRRASTRTKPFILILMTIWPKPNHYARTVGRLISALCVTPPALIKAASTSRKNRLRVKIVVHIHI